MQISNRPAEKCIIDNAARNAHLSTIIKAEWSAFLDTTLKGKMQSTTINSMIVLRREN
jgi:isochorismate hydrolase